MGNTQVNAEYYDVIIVGAGLSGIGAAHQLQQQCPNKSLLILEARNSSGGTWDLFRYPGIRSDSDMHTLGYKFKPWRQAEAIADGPSILNYIKETAADAGLDAHIRHGHQVKSATWSTAESCWTLRIQRVGGEEVSIRCNFLLMCAGYYSYESGYTPEFKGRDLFQGLVVHPQQWPEDLDYRNKKVIIIGSGATAVTLAPEMAKQAEQVVMLQRSPTYIVSRPAKDRIANLLRKWLPEQAAYAITRWKNVSFQQLVYKKSRTAPEQVKQKILALVQKELGPDYDVAKHFTPSYNPWDQRLCLVPNSDLFRSIRSGKTEVVTDHIETFTERGLRLQSGKELEADIIVTATGLNLELLGGVQFSLDDRPITFSDTWTYKGLMFSDVPNLVVTFGYINASWTLRADLIADYVCRLINHMDATGTRQCTPRLRPEDANMQPRLWIDDFSSGYMQRMLHLFPRQGDHDPWTNPQNYSRDKKLLRSGRLEDGVLVFDNSASSDKSAPTTAAGAVSEKVA